MFVWGFSYIMRIVKVLTLLVFIRFAFIHATATNTKVGKTREGDNIRISKDRP